MWLCLPLTGNPRPPFVNLIHSMASFREHYQGHQKSPVIVSVDIPSGWHVQDGDISGDGIKPDMLVKFSVDDFFYIFAASHFQNIMLNINPF